NGVVECFRNAGADMIVPASTNTIFRSYPDGAEAVPYGTFIIDLCQGEETLFAKLNSSHRRKVRLAMKAGMKVSEGPEHLECVYALVRDTFKRSSMGIMEFESFK